MKPKEQIEERYVKLSILNGFFVLIAIIAGVLWLCNVLPIWIAGPVVASPFIDLIIHAPEIASMDDRMFELTDDKDWYDKALKNWRKRNECKR